MNKALISKWFWIFQSSGSMMWCRFLIAKYGASPGGWYTKPCSSPCGELSFACLTGFQRNTCIKIGNGLRCAFWADRWIGEETLMSKFPSVFQRCTLPNATVAELFQNEQPHTWNLHLRRQAFEREIVEEAELCHLLEGVSLNTHEDSLVWNDGMDDFGVQKACQLITQRRNYNGVFPVKEVWIKGVPSRVNFLVWTIILDKTLTVDHLQKRGMQMPNRCYLCKCQQETVKHLFRECPFLLRIWHLLTGHVDGILGRDENITDAIKGRQCRPVSGIGKLLWNGLLHALWWNIWFERYRRAFDGIERNLEQVTCEIKSTLWCWFRFLPLFGRISKDRLISCWSTLFC